MKTKKCSLSITVLIALSLILTTNPCHAYFGENSSQAPSGHKMAAIIAGSAIAGIAGLVLAFGNFFGKNNPSKDTVTYNPNGADSGTAPIDPTVYDDGATPKVLDNPGKLGKTGFKHIGWSDVPNATTAQYTTGENIESLSGPKALYAVYGASIAYKDTSGATGAPPVDSGQYTEGSAAIVLDQGTLNKSNYFFQGWSLTNGALASDYRPGDPIIIPVTGDLTLYSVWSLKPYGVNYYANGATAGSVPVDVQYYNSGEAATILDNTGNLVKTGFHFLGWSTNPNASAPEYIAGSLATILSSSLNLYAVWTCNITYNANSNSTNGSVPIDINNYINGSLAPIASQGNLTNQGYYFKNWSNNSSAIIGNYIPGTNTTMTGDLTLFAIWNQKPYSVTYYPNGATSGDVPVTTTYYDINDVAKARGNDAQAPLVPLANPGFNFLGWSNNPNAAAPQYVSGDNISFANANNGAVDLFAVWVCKIAYDSNGGIGNVTPDLTNYTRNSTAILSNGTGITKPNYHISGWTNDNTSNDYNLSQSIIMSGNLYLTANWTLNSLNIAYDINNATGNVTGNAPADSTLYNTGDNATILSPVFLANPGFNNFSGWSTDNNSTIVQYSSTGLNNSSNKITFGLDNITLYAVWNCGITYNGYGNTNGTAPVDNNSYAFGDSVTIQGQNNLTKDNYLFNTWIDTNGDDYEPGNTTLMEGSLNLFALWEEKPYSITYNDNGTIQHTNGTLPVDNGSYDTGDIAKILNSNYPLVDATDPGYIFMGWSTESVPTTQVQYSYNGSYNSSSNITFGYEDISLNAVWGGNLTYNASGATGNVPLDNATYVVGSTAIARNQSTLTMPGAYFHGWSDSPAPEQIVDYLPSDAIDMNGNTTVYAVWDSKPFFVNYTTTPRPGEVYGRPPIDSNGYDSGSIAKVLNNTGSAPLIYINHRFLGWDTNASGTVNDSGFYAPDANLTISNESVTLNALWNDSQIQYYGNNNSGFTGIPTNDAAAYSNNSTVYLKNSTYIRTGRTFQGWDIDQNATNATYQPNGTFNFTYSTYYDNSTGIYKFYAIWGYGITYNANGATNGTAPVDNKVYSLNASVTVLPGAGNFTGPGGVPLVGWNSKPDGTGSSYAINSTFNITQNINLYANWIGGSYGGGTVIYIGNGTNNITDPRRVLVMSNVDQASTARWANGTYVSYKTGAFNGGYDNGNLMLGYGNGTIGAGSANASDGNTYKIVKSAGAANSPAAQLCIEYKGSDNNETDWYLPSLWELKKMSNYATAKQLVGASCTGRVTGGIQCFNNTVSDYWSSTEGVTGNGTTVGFMNFKNGGQAFEPKTHPGLGVRAVRYIQY